MKFSIKDFVSKCDRSFLRIWPYFLKKSLMEQENLFFFCISNNGNYTSVKVFGSYSFRAKNEQNEINAVFYDSVLRRFKSNYPEVFLRKAVLRKCRRRTMPKWYFNQVALQLYRNSISAWVFSWKFVAFSKYFSSKNINRLIFVQPYISWIFIIQVYSVLCMMVQILTY